MRYAIRWMMTLAALALCLGCGQNGSESAEGETAKAPQRKFLSIGTAPAGGAFFVVGGALAKTAQDNSGDLGWQVNAEATKGTQENIRRLVGGELDFGMANAAISYFAVRGEGAWGKPHEIRSVMTLAPNVAMFVTAKSSGINSIADLKGKRVMIGPAGAGFDYFVRPIVEAHGIAYDEIDVVNATQAAAVGMLQDGSISAAFLGGAVPTASITQASAGMDLLLIPFDPAVREKLIADYPFFQPVEVPAGTYRDMENPYLGLNVGSMHLITSADADETTVYEITKRLYEHREEVVSQHPAGKAINPKNVIRDTGTPFHPGAIRYYREIGIWPETP